MRQLFVLSLVIFFSYFSFGQGFEKHYATQFTTHVGPIIELPDSGYVLFVNRYVSDAYWEDHPIDIIAYKVSSNGTFTDSLVINNPDSAISFSEDAYIVNSQIVVFATIIDTSVNKGNGFAFGIDFNLNLLWSHTIPLLRDRILIHSTFKESDSIFYISGEYFSKDFTNYGYFIVKLNQYGSILDSVTRENIDLSYYLLYVPTKDNFRLITPNQIHVISKDLQQDSIIWTKPSSDPVFSFIRSKMIDDSTFITVGRILAQYTPGGIIWDNCLQKRRIDSTSVSVFQFGQSDTTEQPGVWSMDFIHPDSIMFISQSNAGHSAMLTNNPQDFWLSLYNINQNGSINWYKRYGTNGAYRYPRFIITSDGGYLIACERYDWQHYYPQYFSDLYVVKINSKGELNTSGIEENNLSSSELNYYVDVQNNNLMVNSTSEKSTILISDLSGKILIEGIVNKGNNVVHLKQFSKGIYFLSLINNNRKVGTGKFVIP